MPQRKPSVKVAASSNVVPRRVTLKDVALHAGVGHPTVSTVLSNSAKGKYVSEATRQRVLRAVEELGYQPNQSARTMKTGRFGSVAFLMTKDVFRSGLQQPLLMSIHDTLSTQNNHLMLVRLPDSSLSDESMMPRILREWTVDGLLVALTYDTPPRMIELIRRHHIPAIWLNSDVAIDCVRPDDEGGGYMAARYFIDQGHRSIAYVNQPGPHYSTVDRTRGYLRAMREAGLKPQVRETNYYLRGPAEQIRDVRSWLTDTNRPSAFIFYAHQVAELTLHVASQLGLRVPDDFSMLGISEQQQLCLLRSLDTLIVPFREVGELAVQLLLQKTEDPRASFPMYQIPYAVIERGDTSRAL
jgi:DNA-binding LacI/PurR family transcriptional regulator